MAKCISEYMGNCCHNRCTQAVAVVVVVVVVVVIVVVM
jgi:hypothetical protein